MSLTFLESNKLNQSDVINYLVNHIKHDDIRKDLLSVLLSAKVDVSNETILEVITQSILVCKKQELETLFDIMAIHNIKDEKIINLLINKDIYSTACFVSDHLEKDSPLMISIIRLLTEKLITNIVDYSDATIKYEYMSILEEVRDLWLTLLQRQNTNNDLINSIFLQLFSGYLGNKNNSQQQAYMVDLVAKTKYGTHYQMNYFEDLDYHFLSALTKIATELVLPNKNIMKYLHLNPSNNWHELYIAANDLDGNQKLEDLKDLQFIV